MHTPLKHIWLFFVVSQFAHATLTFESKEITQVAEIGATSASAIFSFENTGDSPVTITAVETSCGCTATALEKKVYAPGESGSIEAVLNIGDRLGRQRTTVHVYTSYQMRPYVLAMATDIPVVMTLSPRIVLWMQDDGPETKTIDLIVEIDELINIVSVETNNEAFDVKLSEIEEGKHFSLAVTPLIEGTQRTMITVKTDFPAENPKQYRLQAYVR